MAAVILLVEDNEENMDMLTRRLLRAGYEVAAAKNGVEGLARARERRPNLILMDMSMPVMDGWEATRWLKADPELRTIPVIGLSAHAMLGDETKARDAGVDDYDTKPVEWKRLQGKIAALLAATAPK